MRHFISLMVFYDCCMNISRNSKTNLAAAPLSGKFIDFRHFDGVTYALGLTYRDHILETGEVSVEPVVFLKQCAPMPVLSTFISMPSSEYMGYLLQRLSPTLSRWLISKFGSIPVLLDYEVEIGILIFENISESELLSGRPLPKLGFFLTNDLTARAIQIAGEGSTERLQYWSAAKSLPQFFPVTTQIWCPDDTEVEVLPDLMLKTYVNGQLRQAASTRSIIYSLRQMLLFSAAASPDKCLRAGDRVLTGTPAGVALSIPLWKRRLGKLFPHRQRIQAGLRSAMGNRSFLQVGDVVEVSADWLGSFKCSIVPS